MALIISANIMRQVCLEGILKIMYETLRLHENLKSKTK